MPKKESTPKMSKMPKTIIFVDIVYGKDGKPCRHERLPYKRKPGELVRRGFIMMMGGSPALFIQDGV